MNNGSLVGFVLSLILSALILLKAPVSKTALTVDSLKRNNYGEIADLVKLVSTSCRDIAPVSDNELERDFIRYNKFNFAKDTRRCLLKMTEASSHFFYLKVTKAVHITLAQESNTNPIFEKKYLTNFLLPLALLPFAAFFMAILFEIKFLLPSTLFAALFFFYSGMNPLDFLSFSRTNFKEIFIQDKNLLGLCLLFIWTRISISEKCAPNLSKSILLVFGAWNPAFIITTRRTFMRLGNSLTAKSFLLSLHALFLILSFTLLVLPGSWEDIFLPRYFSLAFVLILAFQTIESYKDLPLYSWKSPIRMEHLVTILMGELLFYYFKPPVPFILRLSVELLLSELFRVKEWTFDLREAKFIINRIAILLFSSLAAFYSSRFGVLDLLYRTLHLESLELGLPIALFCFGIVAGAVFGSIAIPYFFMLSFYSQLLTLGVAKAGLMDGLILGVLLSPFSLFNWFASKDLQMGVHSIITTRFTQLRLSIFAGSLVYFVSGMSTTKILQPVTFLFLLLVIFVNKMRLRQWKWA